MHCYYVSGERHMKIHFILFYLKPSEQFKERITDNVQDVGKFFRK